MKDGLILGTISTLVGLVLYGIISLYTEIDLGIMLPNLVGIFIGTFIFKSFVIPK